MSAEETTPTPRESEVAEENDEVEIVSRGVNNNNKNNKNKYNNNNKNKYNKRPTKPKLSPLDKKIQKEFMLIDIDNSGYIDVNDLKKIFRFGIVINENMMSRVIKLMDTNKDGKISLTEYKNIRKILGNITLPHFGGKENEDSDNDNDNDEDNNNNATNNNTSNNSGEAEIDLSNNNTKK